MRKPFLLVASFCVLAIVFPGVNGQSANKGEGKGGLITLYARDPLAQAFCFRDAGYGKVFQDGEVRNRCSDLAYGSYETNSFSTGIEGGRQGVIIDVGTPSDLQHQYRYEETVGQGQGFASISRKDQRFYLLESRRDKTMQEFKEAEQLFLTPVSTRSSATVKAGHIYLIRLTDRHDKEFELVVKLLVVAYSPNEAVTLRWEIL